jgi:histidine ammonia-lyase
MGFHGGLQLREVLASVRAVLAIEALCAAQALDLRAPLAPARGTGAAHAALRERVATLREDREVAVDIEAADRLVASGALVAAVEPVVGGLG